MNGDKKTGLDIYRGEAGLQGNGRLKEDLKVEKWEDDKGERC